MVMVVLMVIMRRFVRMIVMVPWHLSGTHTRHHYIDMHLPGMFEHQRHWKSISFHQSFLQAIQHQMQASRLQHSRAARRNFDVFQRFLKNTRK